MNILIISQSLSGGGAEKVAANLSLALGKTDNIVLLTYRQDENEYRYDGIRININSEANSLLGRIYQSIRRIVLVAKYKKLYRIEQSVSFVPQCDYANILSSFFIRCKTVIEVSSNMSMAFPCGFRRMFRRFIMSEASKIAVVSDGSRQNLIEKWNLPGNKLTTIYNSIDIDNILKTRDNEMSAIIDGEYIIAMGSFRKPKGHWHLLKAFSIVRQKIHTNIKLLILGDGPYREKYCELIRNLGLEGAVVMPGFVQPPYPYISKSLFMVFPSIYEGFGNVIIEAMVCGVPVIAADCDFGPREILAPTTDIRKKTESVEISKYGVLTPPFDMSDIDVSAHINNEEIKLADAICDLMENQSLRETLVRESSHYCRRFSNEIFASNWKNMLYKNG